MDLHPIIQLFALDVRARFFPFFFPPGFTLKYFTGKEFSMVEMLSLNDLREIEFDIGLVVHMRFLVAWRARSLEIKIMFLWFPEFFFFFDQ